MPDSFKLVQCAARNGLCPGDYCWLRFFSSQGVELSVEEMDRVHDCLSMDRVASLAEAARSKHEAERALAKADYYQSRAAMLDEEVKEHARLCQDMREMVGQKAHILAGRDALELELQSNEELLNSNSHAVISAFQELAKMDEDDREQAKELIAWEQGWTPEATQEIFEMIDRLAGEPNVGDRDKICRMILKLVDDSANQR